MSHTATQSTEVPARRPRRPNTPPPVVTAKFPDALGPRGIIAAICEAAGCTLGNLRSSRRAIDGVDAIVIVRRATCVALRANGMTIPQIGRLLDRDHTTVSHHLRQYDDGVDCDVVQNLILAAVVVATEGRTVAVAALAPEPVREPECEQKPVEEPVPVSVLAPAPPVQRARPPIAQPVRVDSETGPCRRSAVDVKAEAARLREANWSIPAIARHLGTTPDAIAVVLGVPVNPGAAWPERPRAPIEPLF